METIKLHENYMQRCLQLARNGDGRVAPNPLVGAVIVHNNKIIGEGFHQKFGEAHAEVNAINSVKNKSLLTDATIYVNLEPCAHYGKTPPCASLIVQNKIPRVVIGMQDPFAQVNGAGIKILKDAGCEVKLGVLKQECRELNHEFVTFHMKKRPYIVLKWAQTRDGYIDKMRNQGDTAKPNWITNEVCRSLVHKWRTRLNAIMIGTNTAAMDNPRLNVRSWAGKNPLRVVIDKDLRLHQSLQIFDNLQSTLVLNKKKQARKNKIEFLRVDFGDGFLQQLMQILYERNISGLLVEGGQELLQSFISKNLWDDARVFTGNKIFEKGIKAPKIRGTVVTTEILGDNYLTIYKNS